MFLVGPALQDGLCKLCRTELTELGGRTDAATGMARPVRSADWTEHLAHVARQLPSKFQACETSRRCAGIRKGRQ